MEPSQSPSGRTVAVILAAGKSTRMKSRLPKAVHPLCGRPMIWHVLSACSGAGVSRMVVVIGHQGEVVKQALGGSSFTGVGERVTFAWQTEQRGTGHALMVAEPHVPPDADCVLVMPSDAPLVTADDIRQFVSQHVREGNDATLLTAVLADGGHYGRIVRGPDGSVQRIVEAKDADPDVLAIREINAAIYCFRPEKVFAALKSVRPDNAQGEYYLTDVIGLLRDAGGRVGAVVSSDPSVVLGINHRAELAEVEAVMRARILRSLMLSGVTVVHPASTYIDVGVDVGPDTVIHPNTHVLGDSRVGADCVLGPNSVVLDSVVGDCARVVFSYVVNAQVGEDAVIGPFAHLTGGCRVGAGARVGSFVSLDGVEVAEGMTVSCQSVPQVDTQGGGLCKD
ncbi:MAG: bifunctional UDP-N-acetylglucosamine diphosphorylase/glucosamine-1-phosphate N-acetyltransferase GlmU [Armatimonadota bacterium]